MTNLNLLFHKIYYDQIGTNDFERAVENSNKKLFCATFVNAEDFQQCEIPDVRTVRLKTKYPGLLIGTGYPHGSGRADDDIKCGFSFDYVSGQPYIPGSSVKGILRSHFKDHPEAVAEIAGISKTAVKALEENIFDYGDTFLDAVLYDGDKNNRILGKEYITPHSEPTKNPIPIHIMKVLPDVRFEFRFIVSDFNKDGFTFTADRKKELFETLLTLFGVGAKTNVGYGALESDDSAPRARVQQQTSEQTTGNHYGNNNYGNNNYGGNNRGNNNYGGNNRGGGNNNNRAGNGGGTDTPKVKCPDCGYYNFKFRLDGVNRNTVCKRCGAKLP